MKVGIIGAGHVGLPTAAALAHLGHDVVLYDSDADKIGRLEKGDLPFYEPDLDDLVRAGVEAERLSFSSDPAPAIEGAEVAFICVGTPPRASGEANLVAMEKAAQAVAQGATGDMVVVQKSTVPTGTATRLAEHMARYNNEHHFDVVSNPEFLREGKAVQDSLQPSRILIGTDSDRAGAVLRELYAALIEAGTEWIETDVATAELSKHAANAFLAMKISFANSLAQVCELAGADVVSVAEAIGSDPRIGREFLNAGLGYGGYCLPKDVAAFERVAARLGYDFPLLREIARINDEAIETAFAKIEQELWNLEGKRIALLGLAFKPNTDDTRFSPALALADLLLAAGADVVGYDPQAAGNAKQDVPQLEIAPDAYTALDGAHLAVIATDWPEFEELDLPKVRELMEVPIIVDGRNVFDRRTMAAEGFTYLPTGRPEVRPRGADRRRSQPRSR